MRRSLVTCAVVAALSRSATADPSTSDLLKSARQHFDLQEYAQAEADLKEAYRLEPKPDILYALAQAQRMNGECDKAIVSYQNYLRSNPRADQAKLATENIERCKAELAAKPTPTPSPEPKPTPAPTPPPKPAPTPAAPATHTVGVAWSANLAGHVLVGGGLVAAVGGTLLALHGQHAIDDINSAMFYDDFVTRSKAASTANTERIAGIATAGLGGALIVTGIAIYWLRSPHQEASPTIAIGPHGELVAGWSF
jgi:tetratricopeptide (TPR) repeat protein